MLSKYMANHYLYSMLGCKHVVETGALLYYNKLAQCGTDGRLFTTDVSAKFTVS